MASVKRIRILLGTGLIAGLLLIAGCGLASSPSSESTPAAARRAPTATAVPVAKPTVAPTEPAPAITPATTPEPNPAPASGHGVTPPATPLLVAPPSKPAPSKPAPAPASKPTPVPTPAPTPKPKPTPIPEPEPALSSGMVGLFLAINGGSSSNLLRTVSTDSTSGEMTGSKYITIEKSAKAVVLYVPERGEATLIDSYTSPSYAPHTKRPHTFDDRLFVGTKYSTSLNYAEYDPQTLLPVSNAMAKQLVQASQNRFVLKGARPEDPVTSITRVDPLDPEASKIVASFEVSGAEDYVPSNWWQMAEDNDVVYWAAMSYQGERLLGEVWSFRLDDPESDPLMHSFTVPGAPGEMSMILKFDVDDGHAVIQPRFTGYTDSRLILYDLNTGSVDLVDTGLRIFDVQILHLGE